MNAPATTSGGLSSRGRRRSPVGVSVVVLMALVATVLAAPPLAHAARTGDPDADDQWHLDAIQVPRVWSASTGSGAVVAVVDSGITPGPDLGCRRFVAEHDARTGRDGRVGDSSGHGTHIAGVIAQCSGNGLRTAGVARDATLMDVKALSGSPGDGGSASSSDVAAAIRHAATNGAQVINLSIAAPCPASAPTYARGCRFADIDAAIAIAVLNDVVVVAAAGNDGSGRVGYPATHPEVIAVGSVDASLRSPGYASTGSALDVVAPGGVDRDTDGDGLADGIFQEWYDPARGTHRVRGLFGSSQAAANVSGVAALLRSARPGADRDAIRAALVDSACDLGAAGGDTTFGAGLVRAADAVAALRQGVGRGVCFFDVQAGDTFFGDVSRLAQEGITRGCTQPAVNRFCPRRDVSRGEMAAFIRRALDLPRTSRDFFRDDERSRFEDDINRLAAAGITRGCNPPTNDRFCPGDDVSRGAMAAFLRRALDLPRTSRDFFRDDERSRFEDDINRLAAAGITRGCNPPANDRYCPTADVTREQMAAFIIRGLRRTGRL